jgi:hypothetical protein
MRPAEVTATESPALFCSRDAANPAADVARAAVDAKAARGCTSYLAALESALSDEPPPYGTSGYAQLYFEAARSSQWLAISLMSNAEREGDGSRRLWSLAACAESDDEKRLLKRHAVDESRHSLAYLALLDLTFPGCVSAEFRKELRSVSPHFSTRQEPFVVEGSPYARTPSIDDFVQMNIAEIRTALHHGMQRDAIKAHCPPENQARARGILDVIYGDELSHVAYSAELIDQKAEEVGPRVLQEIFCRRVCDFNRITRQELGDAVFHCSCKPLDE